MDRLVSVIVVGLAACTSGTAPAGGADAPGGSGSGVRDSGRGGDDAPPSIDATPTPFGCLGKPVPTSAPDPVTLSGSAATISGTSEVAASGVKITAVTGAGTAIGSATTDASGAYSLSLPTGGHALDVHLTATKSGDRESTLYPATSLYESTSAGFVLIISQADFDFVAQLSGETQSTKKGAIGMAVIDCEGSAVAGATVSTSPAGDIVYVANGQPDANATATDSTGVALVFNVPPGDVTVSAQVGGMTLRSHVVQAAAGVTTTAAIRP